jgi:hypothetical protein
MTSSDPTSSTDVIIFALLYNIILIAANILNKQSRTADKGWSSSLGLGVGLTTRHRKK